MEIYPALDRGLVRSRKVVMSLRFLCYILIFSMCYVPRKQTCRRMETYRRRCAEMDHRTRV